MGSELADKSAGLRPHILGVGAAAWLVSLGEGVLNLGRGDGSIYAIRALPQRLRIVSLSGA